MISIESVQAFLLFAVAAAITPGPSNMMLVAVGSQAGFVRGLPCLLGVASGMGLLLAAATDGLGGTVQMVNSASFATSVRWAGAATLLWLAWRIGSADPTIRPENQRPVGLLAATAFQWINPKSWLVASSAAAGMGEPDGLGLAGHALANGLMFFGVAIGAGGVWLVAGSALQRVRTDPASARAFNVAMGVLLAASGILSLR